MEAWWISGRNWLILWNEMRPFTMKVQVNRQPRPLRRPWPGLQRPVANGIQLATSLRDLIFHVGRPTMHQRLRKRRLPVLHPPLGSRAVCPSTYPGGLTPVTVLEVPRTPPPYPLNIRRSPRQPADPVYQKILRANTGSLDSGAKTRTGITPSIKPARNYETILNVVEINYHLAGGTHVLYKRESHFWILLFDLMVMIDILTWCHDFYIFISSCFLLLDLKQGW